MFIVAFQYQHGEDVSSSPGPFGILQSFLNFFLHPMLLHIVLVHLVLRSLAVHTTVDLAEFLFSVRSLLPLNASTKSPVLFVPSVSSVSSARLEGDPFCEFSVPADLTNIHSQVFFLAYNKYSHHSEKWSQTAKPVTCISLKKRMTDYRIKNIRMILKKSYIKEQVFLASSDMRLQTPK